MTTIETINIRPGVSILSVLRHLNYKPWFAMAEFVDNSFQSYITNAKELRKVEGKNYRLKVSIELDDLEGGRLTIRDNAAGIQKKDYPRAFRPAAMPPSKSGLSEFGMGMKSAACWFANKWMVRTAALGERIERTVNFDIDKIVKDDLEDLTITQKKVDGKLHYTEISLIDLHKIPQGNTVKKIKEHLASIYRVFIQNGTLILEFDGETLEFSQPKILSASYFKNTSKKPIQWRKEINFDLGSGLTVKGFAALREVANVSGAGFALFRNSRVIQGSADEGYRPEFIFKKSNSYTYQRLFGELHLTGFDVSHTKDGFRWDENEQAFLELLKEHLNSEPIPLLDQAEGHRVRQRADELLQAANSAANHTAATIQREIPNSLGEQFQTSPDRNELPIALPKTLTASTRTIDIEINKEKWRIILELSNDPAVGEWIEIADHLIKERGSKNQNVRQVGIRMALAHPFMERFAGSDPDLIEALLRVGCAIVLGEIAARNSGVKMAGTVRRNINKILRDALSNP